MVGAVAAPAAMRTTVPPSSISSSRYTVAKLKSNSGTSRSVRWPATASITSWRDAPGLSMAVVMSPRALSRRFEFSSSAISRCEASAPPMSCAPAFSISSVDGARLTVARRAPSTDEMLKAGAQLIGGALASQRLIAELENSNRLLSALGDMTTAMLKPGASRHEVIDAVVGHLTDSEVPEFDFNFATVYLLDQREDDATVVRMAAGAATAASIEGTAPHAGKKVPRWALDEDRLLAESDVLVYVARTWQTVIVGPLPAGDHGDVISGGVPVQSTWTEVPVVYTNGMVLGNVLASLIGEKERARGEEPAPFTLAGEVFDRGGHKDLIRVFVPFGSDATRRATGVLEVGYHRSDQRRPDWGQVEALRAAAGQL